MLARRLADIARPGNGIIAAIGVFAGYSITIGAIEFTPMLGIGMLTALVITSAGNAVNDYFDSEIDKKLGRQKFAGERDRNIALVFAIVLFILGNGLAFTINTQALAIAAGTSALLILYSWLMQGFKFLGNWVVAGGTALTLVFGAAIAQQYNGIFLLAAAAFFANVAREIIKDSEDLEGDAGIKNTLPMFVEFSGLKKIIFLLYLAAISTGIIAFWLGILKGPWFVALFVVSAGAFLESFRLFNAKKFLASQKFSKYAMIIALAAFMAGTI